MLSLKTMSNWLSRDRRPNVSPCDKVPLQSLATTQAVSKGGHDTVLQTDRQRLLQARVAKLGDESGDQPERSRRVFLQAATGIAAVVLGIDRVYEGLFEVHNSGAAASGQFDFDEVPLDVARFAAEHWNPLMLEELYLGQKHFK